MARRELNNLNRIFIANYSIIILQTSSTNFHVIIVFPFYFYRIYLKGLTGTAGKISSISQPGNDFSTKDADNDKCICKCSQMLTGGTNVFMFLSLPIFFGTEIVYGINNFDLVNFDYLKSSKLTDRDTSMVTLDEVFYHLMKVS